MIREIHRELTIGIRVEYLRIQSMSCAGRSGLPAAERPRAVELKVTDNWQPSGSSSSSTSNYRAKKKVSTVGRNWRSVKD